jgi:hypothetical protein
MAIDLRHELPVDALVPEMQGYNILDAFDA